MSVVPSTAHLKSDFAQAHGFHDGAMIMRKPADITLTITSTSSDQGDSQHGVNSSLGTPERSSTRAFEVERNHDLQYENGENGSVEQPLMNDISSFLETMHSKNLTLKKLAKHQQNRIEQLIQENEVLKTEKELKDAEVKELRSHVQTLREELRESSSKRLRPKTILRKEALRATDTFTVLVPAKEPVAESQGTAGSVQPSSRPEGVLRSPASSKPKQNAQAKSMSIITAEHRTTKRSVGEVKNAMAASHRTAMSRLMQIVRKINSGARVAPASVESNLYTVCWPLMQGAMLAMLRPDLSSTVSKICA